MSQVYQRVMSDGDWQLDLADDTPYAVRELLIPFTTHVVITPGEIDITSSDSVFLNAARYVGVIRRLGRNRLQPGGPHICSWLSDPDGKGEILTSKIELTASASLTNWINALDDPASIAAGTITDPGGTFGNTYQWVSRRQAITHVCLQFGVEWIVQNDFTIDVGTVGALYRSVAAGDTPTAVVARRVGGRDPQIVGIRAAMETSVDWEDYVSEVYAIGNGVGNSGGPSPFRKPVSGGVFTWRRVVVDPAAPAGALNAVAASVRAQLPDDEDGRREIRVSTDLFDIGGDVTLGDDVYVWDDENGIVDTGNQLHYRGELIYPQALRCIGMRWPVRRGMGVYLRIQNSTGTPTYENITPYVVFSEGAAELELGTASRTLRSDSAGQLVEVSGQVQAGPWTPYTPTLSGASLGAGTSHGFYRREGSTLHLRIRITFGAGMSVTGPVTISLPSGFTAVTETDGFQYMFGIFRDTGTTEYKGAARVTTGSTTLTLYAEAYNGAAAGAAYLTYAAVATAVPHTWASTDVIAFTGTIEVDP